MTPKRRPYAPLAVILALFAAGAGCEIVASFDRSLIPIPETDGATYDAAFPEGGGPDTSTTGDANGPGDDGGVDSSTLGDANLGDSSVADINVPDTRAADGNVGDVNVADTNVPDTNVPDTNVPDTNVADTNVPDASDGATE